jgi:hypothetical protein
MMPSITNGNYSRMLKEASAAIKGEMMKDKTEFTTAIGVNNKLRVFADENRANAPFKGDIVSINEVTLADNQQKLKAIHVVLKQIASNTENLTTADIAKVAATNLQEVIESICAQNSEQN